MAELMLGMLWFDNDKTRSLEQKIERAVRYYREKHHMEATHCFLNPATMNGSKHLDRVGEVILIRSCYVLVNHFWIGGAMLVDGFGYQRGKPAKYGTNKTNSGKENGEQE
jgi:hypothetical protein